MHNSNNKVDTVFVLMIFCAFAVSVFLVLMLSASTYRNMVDTSKEGQNERISLSYVRTMIRNADSAGSISVGDFHGLSALSLEEVFGESTFVTLIYHYDGWVHELFHEKGQAFLPGEGVPIIRSDSMSFEVIDNGLIRVATDSGSMLILPRSAAAVRGRLLVEQ